MNRIRRRWTRTCLCSLVVALSLPVVMALAVARPAAADAGFPGTSSGCAINKAYFDADIALVFAAVPALEPIVTTIGAFELPNGLGVAWVDPSHPMQTETGVVMEKSDYSTADLPWDHNSHDQSFDVQPDSSSQFLLSDANFEDKNGLIENEWESADFPEWAWPNVGDRVWVNGNWVLDCNHEVGTSDHYDAEIHPVRAIATMRQEMHTLPGSGTTPVAVMGTDLYIHGDGGYATTVLQCGVNVVTTLGKLNDSCTAYPGIAEDYDFEIPLGKPPFAGAVPACSVEDGPANTLAQAATCTYESASTLDGGPAYLVHVPLAGSGATNDDVYARKIYTGWVAPKTGLHHYVLTLTKGHIKDDMNPIPDEGCDCRQFFMSVNRAPDDEWSSLVGYDKSTDQGSIFCPGDNHLDNWRDCGNGNLDFTGPSFDFYAYDGQSIAVHFKGLAGKCGDDAFGSPNSFAINGIVYAGCAVYWYGVGLLGLCCGGPDDINIGGLNQTFDVPLTVGDQLLDDSNTDYRMTIHVDEIPLDQEDSADLGLTKTCTPSEVTAPGPFTCRIEVTNAGPGLPHDVKVTSTITAPTANYTIANAELSWENVASPPAPVPCTVSGNQVICNLNTVPLGGAKGVINYDVSSTDGGTFTDTAKVTSGSTDSNAANDSATASVHVSVPTRTALTPSVDPSQVRQTVTYTATVSAAVGTSTPVGGTVTFYDYDLTVGGCLGVALSAAQATCTVTYTATGNHHITASYSGSTDFLPSTSPPLGQTVTKCSRLPGCDLSGADLTNAPEAGVDFRGASFKGATLAGTNFNDAILAGTNLSNGNLTGANLAGADLSGANLLGANLTSANLTRALTTGANFNGVVWSNTTCVDGTNSTTDGGSCIGHL